MENLHEIANQMVLKGKGILAADESALPLAIKDLIQ